MKSEELRVLFDRGREQRGVEFKGPGSQSDKHFMATVTRAAMGMANRRDGGYVIVGVAEENGEIVPKGLTPEQAATWRYDNVADFLASYADPYLDFDLEFCDVDDATFLVLTVEEFAEIPVICKKSFNDKLADGALYVRSRRKPETIPVASHTDMRDLIELTTTKAIRKLMARAHEAGLGGVFASDKSDEQLFATQAKELL